MYEKQYEVRNQRKEKGLCVQCGIALDREGIYCKRCNDNNRKSKDRYREELEMAGLCLQCAKPVGREGLFCRPCLTVSNRKANIRNAERRLLGLCVRCGQPAEGYSYCQRCRDLRMDKYWTKKIGGNANVIRRKRNRKIKTQKG